jgi:hypothetical protein
MAKRKKRDRGVAPRSAGATETAAPSLAEPSERAASEPSEHTGTAGDRFDPFASPRARMLANAFIALFLAYQVAMPLRYYIGGRGLDERFSWRMFSTVRMLDCKAEVEEQVGDNGEPYTRKVNLKKEIQIAWIGLLERGRPLVVEKLLRRRCDEAGVLKAMYQLDCVAPDGKRLPSMHRHMQCSDKVLAEGRGEP